MRSLKLVAGLAAALLITAGAAWSANAEKPQNAPAKCCVRAAEGGKDCAHACCVTAAKDGKECTKCGGQGNKVKKAA